MHGRMSGRRSVYYPGVGVPITVPSEVWDRTLEELRVYGSHGSEGLVFWGGIVSGRELQVTGLYLPGHHPQGGCVRVTPEEARWLLRTLEKRDEKLLVQVHSHPGSAYHSQGDDELAASFHQGYLSVVAPRFGLRVHEILDCAVFELAGRGFVTLDQDQIRWRFRFVSTLERRLRLLHPATGGSHQKRENGSVRSH